MYLSPKKSDICFKCCNQKRKRLLLKTFLNQVTSIKDNTKNRMLHDLEGQQYYFEFSKLLCSQCFKYHKKFSNVHNMFNHQLSIQCCLHNCNMPFISFMTKSIIANNAIINQMKKKLTLSTRDLN